MNCAGIRSLGLRRRLGTSKTSKVDIEEAALIFF
jgi:hypothetical protein